MPWCGAAHSRHYYTNQIWRSETTIIMCFYRRCLYVNIPAPQDGAGCPATINKAKGDMPASLKQETLISD